MNTPTPVSKDPVTLDALKRAIDNFENLKDGDGRSAAVRGMAAWRTAFEWHVQLIERHAALSEIVGAHVTDWIAIDREEEEGMALIREKLQS